MIYQIDKIIADTRHAIGLCATDPQAIIHSDSEQSALRNIIVSNIIGAVEKAHTEAPAHMLWPGVSLCEEISWSDCGNWGWLMLPDDFMRLIVFEMNDWAIPSYTAITADDATYDLQRSAWVGVKGSWQRPVVAIVKRPEGKTLEFYSCRSKQAAIKRASYLPYPKIDNHGGIDICQPCYPAVIASLAEAAKALIFST